MKLTLSHLPADLESPANADPDGTLLALLRDRASLQVKLDKAREALAEAQAALRKAEKAERLLVADLNANKEQAERLFAVDLPHESTFGRW